MLDVLCREFKYALCRSNDTPGRPTMGLIISATQWQSADAFPGRSTRLMRRADVRTGAPDAVPRRRRSVYPPSSCRWADEDGICWNRRWSSKPDFRWRWREKCCRCFAVSRSGNLHQHVDFGHWGDDLFKNSENFWSNSWVLEKKSDMKPSNFSAHAQKEIIFEEDTSAI